MQFQHCLLIHLIFHIYSLYGETFFSRHFHRWHQDKNVHNFFVIRVQKRDELKTYLEKNGIETKIHYPIPIHLQKSFKQFGYKYGDFPETEKQSSTILTLPVAEHLSKKQIRKITLMIKNFFRWTMQFGTLFNSYILKKSFDNLSRIVLKKWK